MYCFYVFFEKVIVFFLDVFGIHVSLADSCRAMLFLEAVNWCCIFAFCQRLYLCTDHFFPPFFFLLVMTVVIVILVSSCFGGDVACGISSKITFSMPHHTPMCLSPQVPTTVHCTSSSHHSPPTPTTACHTSPPPHPHIPQ